MRRTVFTVVFVLAAVVAYDWYKESQHIRLEIDPGYNVLPIAPIINEPMLDPGPPDYEETNNGVNWRKCIPKDAVCQKCDGKGRV
jgi:hypothetical protein